MVWGRVDDGFWDHDKTLAVLAQPRGLEAIALVPLLISFINKQWRPDGRFNLHEAAMLVKRSTGEAEQLVELLIATVPEGYDYGFIEPRPGGYALHDAIDYMDPKVRAGKEGGAKSGQTRKNRSKREANTKQTPSNGEANAKQNEARIPDPDPGSRDPGSRDPDHPDLDRRRDDPGPLHDHEIEALGFGRFGAFTGRNAAELKRVEPRREELEEALRRSPNARTYAYLAPVIVQIRNERSKPQPPSYRPLRAAAGSDFVEGTKRHMERIRRDLDEALAKESAAVGTPQLPAPESENA